MKQGPKVVNFKQCQDECVKVFPNTPLIYPFIYSEPISHPICLILGSQYFMKINF